MTHTIATSISNGNPLDEMNGMANVCKLGHFKWSNWARYIVITGIYMYMERYFIAKFVGNIAPFAYSIYSVSTLHQICVTIFIDHSNFSHVKWTDVNAAGWMHVLHTKKLNTVLGSSREYSRRFHDFWIEHTNWRVCKNWQAIKHLVFLLIIDFHPLMLGRRKNRLYRENFYASILTHPICFSHQHPSYQYAVCYSPYVYVYIPYARRNGNGESLLLSTEEHVPQITWNIQAEDIPLSACVCVCVSPQAAPPSHIQPALFPLSPTPEPNHFQLIMRTIDSRHSFNYPIDLFPDVSFSLIGFQFGLNRVSESCMNKCLMWMCYFRA